MGIRKRVCTLFVASAIIFALLPLGSEADGDAIYSYDEMMANYLQGGGQAKVWSWSDNIPRSGVQTDREFSDVSRALPYSSNREKCNITAPSQDPDACVLSAVNFNYTFVMNGSQPVLRYFYRGVNGNGGSMVDCPINRPWTETYSNAVSFPVNVSNGDGPPFFLAQSDPNVTFCLIDGGASPGGSAAQYIVIGNFASGQAAPIPGPDGAEGGEATPSTVTEDTAAPVTTEATEDSTQGSEDPSEESDDGSEGTDDGSEGSDDDASSTGQCIGVNGTTEACQPPAFVQQYSFVFSTSFSYAANDSINWAWSYAADGWLQSNYSVSLTAGNMNSTAWNANAQPEWFFLSSFCTGSAYPYDANPCTVVFRITGTDYEDLNNYRLEWNIPAGYDSGGPFSPAVQGACDLGTVDAQPPNIDMDETENLSVCEMKSNEYEGATNTWYIVVQNFTVQPAVNPNQNYTPIILAQ